ncbi:MAG: TdeIII family type II restriction endonuclease [Halobacteriota archaeon]
MLEANKSAAIKFGIELALFNVLIQEVKTRKYNIHVVEREIIEDYKNHDILKIILSRSARSARLIPHYDLARPKKPVRETYWCIKHKRYCTPIDEALKFLNRYSYDTIKRLKDFDRIRTGAFIKIIQGDARKIKLPEDLKIDGVFTSPPYVGIIDYHEQHRYAYELFGFPRQDELEIGPAAKGQNGRSKKKEYQRGVVEVFKNVSEYLKEDAFIFIVANDMGLILKASSKDGKQQKEGRIADFYMLRDGVEYFFEIKTVKPNIDIFTKSKTKLLEWIARRRKPIRAILAKIELVAKEKMEGF